MCRHPWRMRRQGNIEAHGFMAKILGHHLKMTRSGAEIEDAQRRGFMQAQANGVVELSSRPCGGIEIFQTIAITANVPLPEVRGLDLMIVIGAEPLRQGQE